MDEAGLPEEPYPDRSLCQYAQKFTACFGGMALLSSLTAARVAVWTQSNNVSLVFTRDGLPLSPHPSNVPGHQGHIQFVVGMWFPQNSSVTLTFILLRLEMRWTQLSVCTHRSVQTLTRSITGAQLGACPLQSLKAETVAHPQDPHHPAEKPVIHCHKCGEPCKGEVLRVQTKHFHIKCFTCKGVNIAILGQLPLG
ncbi:hypothetical protein CB1_000678022 [Camelus ferus]|nr:hypothetical protein CB1_000678022 [Camelus ferus]